MTPQARIADRRFAVLAVLGAVLVLTAALWSLVGCAPKEAPAPSERDEASEASPLDGQPANWSMDSDCAICHKTEAASELDDACPQGVARGRDVHRVPYRGRHACDRACRREARRRAGFESDRGDGGPRHLRVVPWHPRGSRGADDGIHGAYRRQRHDGEPPRASFEREARREPFDVHRLPQQPFDGSCQGCSEVLRPVPSPRRV